MASLGISYQILLSVTALLVSSSSRQASICQIAYAAASRKILAFLPCMFFSFGGVDSTVQLLVFNNQTPHSSMDVRDIFLHKKMC